MADNNVLLSNMQDLGVMDYTKVGNLQVGAQLGIGSYHPNLDAATPVVFTPTVLLVLQTPTMYDENRTNMAKMIKAVIEGHPKAVTGIDFEYQLDLSPTPIGHDGQNMNVPTKAKRSEVNPSFVFQEVSGNMIWNMFRQWIWDIQNPDTNAAMVGMNNPGPYVMSTYAMTMMAIQFDPTMLPENIIDAAIYTNMFPTGTGTLGLERTIATSKAPERTINFTAIVQHNDKIRAIAKTIAEELNYAKVNYNYATPFTAEVKGNIKEAGYNYEVPRNTEEYQA